jgi:hypothetical protein
MGAEKLRRENQVREKAYGTPFSTAKRAAQAMNLGAPREAKKRKRRPQAFQYRAPRRSVWYACFGRGSPTAGLGPAFPKESRKIANNAHPDPHPNETIHRERLTRLAFPS